MKKTRKGGAIRGFGMQELEMDYSPTAKGRNSELITGIKTGMHQHKPLKQLGWLLWGEENTLTFPESYSDCASYHPIRPLLKMERGHFNNYIGVTDTSGLFWASQEVW